MIDHKEHFHGSDLEKMETIYGIKKEQITSFSANVNPLGISFLLKETLASHIDAITAYPDREYKSLRKAIAAYAGTDFENILVGNGATELISLFIRFLSPKRTWLPAPTYSEYERELLLSGGSYEYFELKEEKDFRFDFSEFAAAMENPPDLLILCNPNNPTSTAIRHSDLLLVLTCCKEAGTFVLVDETYVEFTKELADITAVPLIEQFDNLLILRGISKFFAAPGLRLGYAISGNQSLLADIREKKNPWSINTLASIAGEIMFQDADYIKKTKELIFSERRRVLDRLKTMPAYQVYPPEANFVLARIKKEGLTADDLFDAAMKKGLMIRNCRTFPTLSDKYFRFCFMLPEKNDELLSILETFASPGGAGI